SPSMPLRLTRPRQEKKWGSGKLSRAHGAELPVAVVRWRGSAGDEHQLGELAIDAMPLAVEERAPRSFAVLHRAPATFGVQRDARAIGLGEHQPGARVRNGLAPFIEFAHEPRLNGNESSGGLSLQRFADCGQQARIDRAREARRAHGALGGAQGPGFGPLAVDFRAVV